MNGIASILRAALIVGCIAVSVASLRGDDARPGFDWPQFLGPAGDGRSKETGLLDTWPAEGPPLLWKQAIGEGYSAPSIVGDRAYVHHRRKGDEFVDCVSVVDGTTIWSYKYETDFTDPYGYNGGPRCSPLVANQRIITLGPQGKLLCLNDEGSLVWQHDLATEYTIPDHFFGAGCSPLLEEDRVIVLVGGQPNSGVVSFDLSTGKSIWEAGGKAVWEGVTNTNNQKTFRWTPDEMVVSYSPPIAATIQGRRHLLCLLRQGLASLDPKTGAVNFKHWFRSKLHESVNAARPVVIGDRVLLSAAYQTGSALLNVKPDGKSYDVVWAKPDVLGCHWSTPVVVDEFAYGFDGRHENEASLQCVSLKDGSVAWETSGYQGDPNREFIVDPAGGGVLLKATRKPAPWPYFGRGSKIVADGKFIILGERGTMALARVSSKKFEEVSRFALPDVKPPTWTAPVLSRGRLFLRSESTLYCYDVARREGATPKPAGAKPSK